jgi:ubiquinone/menaquinone biosynthesis C-methylase UbiE
MDLRALLLLISVTMIGFCLSLFFFSEQPVQSLSLDQYKSLQYNEERSHSLEDLNRKILPLEIEELIEDVFEKNHLAGEKTRVMEIGAGNGRVLMQLKKRFPEVEFYGVNKEKTRTFYRRESFVLTALKFEIFTKNEAEAIELPYIVFEDLDFGGKIPYDDNKFDIIFSQNTMGYIKYKFELFDEILRVLKPKGLSVHADVSDLNLYSDSVVVEVRDAMGLLRKRGFDISVLENPETILFKKGSVYKPFPLEPHQALPEDTTNIPLELRRPEMGYNLSP